MSGVEAAFLIATFHVAGSQLSELAEGSAPQGLAAADQLGFTHSGENIGPPPSPSPMSLTLALVPSRTDESMLDRPTSSGDTAEGPAPLGMGAAEALPMAAIRMEIRRRLVYFQWCANAAKRRGVADVRRLSVTWSIAADGSIRAMKLEGVMDPEMAACVARVGSRRFPIEPGTELTVPVPIVFVR